MPTPLEATSPSPTASAAERPEIVFAWEPLAPIAREFMPLFKRHYDELATDKDKIPLDPDWDNYLRLNAMGALHVMTARNDGALVGYVFMIVHPSLHYVSTPMAETDMYWLDPIYRQGLNGYRMLRQARDDMKRIGVKRMFVRRKCNGWQRMDILLKRLGFAETDVTYGAYIGD